MSCLVPILFLALPWYIGNNEPFLTHLYSSCVNSCIVNFFLSIYFFKSLSFLEIIGSHSSKSMIFLIDISGVNVTFCITIISFDNKVLTKGGPFHQQLEQALCRYLGVPHISLFSNGT